jgi:hypothetical protein
MTAVGSLVAIDTLPQLPHVCFASNSYRIGGARDLRPSARSAPAMGRVSRLVDACGMWHCHACHNATRNPRIGQANGPFNPRIDVAMRASPRIGHPAKARRCRTRLNGRKRMGAILWRLGDFPPLFF